MKTAFCTVVCLTGLALTSAHAQPTPPAVPAPPPPPAAPTPAPAGASFSSRLQNIIQQASATPAAEPALTKFDLDFPGGTPKDLVAAIQKAMGRPLNAIIPDDLADTQLPALKMKSVDVSQLFKALTAASLKSEAVISSSGFPPGRPGYSIHQINYGFRQGTEGRPSDDTIWYFYVDKPVLPPLSSPDKVCRFYSLAPYLERGLSVDDITTAIETGWKMLRETSPPTISFHKDTKLLIAVGEPSKLEPIDAVLKALGSPTGVGGGGGFQGGQLEPPKPPKPSPPAETPPKPAERPKTGQ